MARRGQRQSGRSGVRRNGKPLDNEGIIPVLARAVREVESAAQRGQVRPHSRIKFQVVGQLAREERTRVRADSSLTEPQRAEQLKRLDGIGTILAKTAARDTTLLGLLAEDAHVSEAAWELKRDMQTAAGLEVTDDVVADEEELPTNGRAVVPAAVLSRQLSNPFLPPDFGGVEPRRSGPSILATWELIEPLLESFERASDGAAACMPLPEETTLRVPGGLELMKHQAQVVAAAEAGHRSFLLADEPGLGKTAQALLAAQAADAFPLLVVVPNVVKANWAREAGLWTPSRVATVVHGNGDDIDGFADIVVVNYEILDRHVGWLGTLGFGGMVVDEAHFIKNKSSQRSQHVLQLSDRIRARTPRALLMALTGTPLINDIDDFRAIWEFLGWIDEKKPRPALMARWRRTASPRSTAASTPPPAAASSTWASCAAARSTSPPTSPPAASPTCRSSSTTRPAARSARPSASWPAGCCAATTARSRPAAPAASSTASTTRWCARWPRGSARTPSPRRRRTTSSA